MITRTHRYKGLTEDMRLQDDAMDGSGLIFETLEHGGEFPDMMPQAIRVTDPEGRWCVYELITVNGKVVQSYGFSVKYD